MMKAKRSTIKQIIKESLKEVYLIPEAGPMTPKQKLLYLTTALPKRLSACPEAEVGPPEEKEDKIETCLDKVRQQLLKLAGKGLLNFEKDTAHAEINNYARQHRNDYEEFIKSMALKFVDPREEEEEETREMPAATAGTPAEKSKPSSPIEKLAADLKPAAGRVTEVATILEKLTPSGPEDEKNLELAKRKLALLGKIVNHFSNIVQLFAKREAPAPPTRERRRGEEESYEEES